MHFPESVDSVSLSCLLPDSKLLNPLYTGELFHCYMLDELICHFRGVRSIVLLLFNF